MGWPLGPTDKAKPLNIKSKRDLQEIGS